MRNLFFFLLALLGTNAASGAERNILLIIADDHGCDAGCYGNPVVNTPSIDALALDGTLFTHSFCTTASCSASRSVILTGMHNHANGQYGHVHNYHKFSTWVNAASLPVYLKCAGYRTARCGKFHLDPESVYDFEKIIPGGGRNDKEMADNCAGFISQPDERPFFLYFCFSDPHRGGGVDHSKPYSPNQFGNETASVADVRIEYSPEKIVVPGFLPDTHACREELAEYYQAVTRFDAAIGRLLQHLKDAGVYDRTLVIYMSDHGIAMPGAKTTLYEGGMHSPLVVRNPYAKTRGIENNAMISWVDITPTMLDFAGILDTNTTKVEQGVVAKLEQKGEQSIGLKKDYASPGTLHGRSFLSILEKTDPAGWDEVFASHTFHEIQMYYPMRAVRERKYKLIWNIACGLPFPFASDLWAASTWQEQFKQGPEAPYGPWTVDSYIHRPAFELFDIQADPHESKNLADDHRYADTLERMKVKLKEYQRRTNDPWILKWQYE